MLTEDAVNQPRVFLNLLFSLATGFATVDRMRYSLAILSASAILIGGSIIGGKHNAEFELVPAYRFAPDHPDAIANGKFKGYVKSYDPASPDTARSI
ncbi:MAG: hypothetical protein AAF664_09300 [Planctomycetota bacterium]